MRNKSALSELAKASGATAVSLYAIATTCFDGYGKWTGGTTSPSTGFNATPRNACARAIAACEGAKATLTLDLRQQLVSILKEFETPFLGAKYTPQHSNLTNRPWGVTDCTSRVQSELFSQAKIRMGAAHLASQTQSEYQRYRKWLSEASKACRRRSATPSAKDVVAPRNAPIGGPTLERQRALSSSMEVKWLHLARQRTRLEADPDWKLGFLRSRELRNCACRRPVHPQEIIRRLEKKEERQAIRKHDEKNTICEVCLQDAYGPWKTRVHKQCAQMDELTEYELGVLQRSDDGNGLPPRCFDEARARRTANATVATQPYAPAEESKNSNEHVAMSSRVEGRAYYRLLMDASCGATIHPGSTLVRPGELLQIATDVHTFTVTSSCAGSIELYIGREAKPRLTETLEKGKPLRLRLRKQAAAKQ